MEKGASEVDFPIESRWRYKHALGVVIAIIFFIPVLILEWETMRFVPYLFLLISYIPISIIILSLKRSHFHFSVGEDFFTVRQGIVTRLERKIPFSVIQHIFVSQDLFDRVCGLASLTIENAAQGFAGNQTGVRRILGTTVVYNPHDGSGEVGSIGSKIIIPGLSKNNAEKLKQILLQKMQTSLPFDSNAGL